MPLQRHFLPVFIPWENCDKEKSKVMEFAKSQANYALGAQAVLW